MNLGIVIGADKHHEARLTIAKSMAEAWASDNMVAVYPREMKADGRQPIMFQKFQLMLDLFTRHEMLMWLDSDCCVVNRNFKLDDELKRWSTPATQMWIAQDWNGICACMYVVRTTPWAYRFLEACSAVGAVPNSGTQWDQAAIKLMSTPSNDWRIQRLPTSIVADQTIKPRGVPFVWHMSMGGSTEAVMKRLESAMANGKLREFINEWSGETHGVHYD